MGIPRLIHIRHNVYLAAHYSMQYMPRRRYTNARVFRIKMQDDILTIIDGEFERDYELETPWHEVLTEAVLYPSDAAAGTEAGAAHGAEQRANLLDATFSSDSEDSDFGCV